MQTENEKRRRQPRIVGIERNRPHFLSDPADSAQGCRERAEADLRKANDDIPLNARRVLEESARNWLARAELLERLETSFAERSRGGSEDD